MKYVLKHGKTWYICKNREAYERRKRLIEDEIAYEAKRRRAPLSQFDSKEDWITANQITCRTCQYVIELDGALEGTWRCTNEETRTLTPNGHRKRVGSHTRRACIFYSEI